MFGNVILQDRPRCSPMKRPVIRHNLGVPGLQSEHKRADRHGDGQRDSDS